MRIPLTSICLVLASLLTPELAHAMAKVSDPVTFACETTSAAGYENIGGRWAPNRLNGGIQIRVTQADGRWTTWVKYAGGKWNWDGDAKAPEADDNWYMPTGAYVGRTFLLDTKSGKFSYTDTFSFVSDANDKGTANLFIGTCAKH
jgi:hypothetical protein